MLQASVTYNTTEYSNSTIENVSAGEFKSLLSWCKIIFLRYFCCYPRNCWNYFGSPRYFGFGKSNEQLWLGFSRLKWPFDPIRTKGSNFQGDCGIALF